MKETILSKRKVLTFISGILICITLTACTSKGQDAQLTGNNDQTTQSGTVQVNEATDTDENTETVTDSASDKTKALTGQWEMIYTIYESQYGKDEHYNSCDMSDDPYSPSSAMNIYEKDGKMFADYKFSGFESNTKYLGNELLLLNEPAYKECKNQEWCYKFTDPFEEDESGVQKITLIDDDTLICSSVYTDGEVGSDEYYYSVTSNYYIRKESEKLKDRESLRYFETATVSNAQDLLNSIANNKKVLLEAGTYDFSAVNEANIHNDFVTYEYGEYKISGVNNFCIEAKEGADVLICVDDAYSPVMHFMNTRNVTLRNITAGHNVEPGYCSGSVIELESAFGMKIDNCRLFGCGTYGIEGRYIDYMEVLNSDIYECTYGLLSLGNAYTCNFKDCTFRDSSDLSMITVDSGYDINFENCEFKNNRVSEEFSTCYFVELSEYAEVTFTDCSFKNNQYSKFANRKVKQINCMISDNGDPDMSNVDESHVTDASGLISEYDEVAKRQKEIDDSFGSDSLLDQQTMNSLSYESYDMWDHLLNDIWGYLRNTLEEKEMDELTEEQKQWIKEKEASVRAAGADFEGGSMQPMLEYSTGSDITKKRVDYLMDKFVR